MSNKIKKTFKKADKKFTKFCKKNPGKATALAITIDAAAFAGGSTFIASKVYDYKRRKELAIPEPEKEKTSFISKLNPFKKKGKTTTKTTSTSDTVEETEEK